MDAHLRKLRVTDRQVTEWLFHTRSIAKILQINVRVSSSLGHPYIIQLAAIYERMLQARPELRARA
jgi:hypothetical protein